MRKSIAFFDFDGTITTRDTLLEIIRYQKGSTQFYIGFTLLSPWMIAMKLGMVSNSSVKQKVLRYFFRDTPLEAFQQKCNSFIDQKLPGMIRPGAIASIHEHLKKGDEVVVVSASARNWLEVWCNKNNISLISSMLEIKNGLLTGNLQGDNCNGIEKVRRIKEKYSLSDFETIYAYGDTKGDKPMLELATFAYYKPFRV